MTAKNKRRDSGSGASDARAEIGVALGEIRQSVARNAAARQEDLGPLGLAVVDAGAPEWTVRAHNRLGHVGGFILFVCLMVIGWPLLVVLVSTLVRIVGVNVVTRIPASVLGELGVPVELAASTSDRFLFTWVIPVVFFVLVLAGLTCLALRRVVLWSWEWTRRLALGLFAGYGTTVLADRRDRRAQKIDSDSAKAAGRRQRAGDDKAHAARDTAATANR
ncbi:hypothetical protein AB0O58_25860 [Rhodococcus sp. NPDC080181]|jgi:hypothetical protein|uniref:hypothetical protein n=1 Tax=Rhodococcus sp. NPDC080181 TaxID=3155292 RepID=UPI00344EB4FF